MNNEQVVQPEHVSFKGGTTVAFKEDSPWPGQHAHLHDQGNGLHTARIHRKCDGETIEIAVANEVIKMADGRHL